MYLCARGIHADLVSFYVVSLRVSAAWDIISPHILLRSSAVVINFLFLDRNVRGILTSCMVFTCSSAKDTCFVVFSFEIISATIGADILSALYFLSLLITASYVSGFLSLFTVNIVYACAAVTDTSATRRLSKFYIPA